MDSVLCAERKQGGPECSGRVQVGFRCVFQEKRFACSLCEKRYIHSKNLKEHIKTVHLNSKMLCPECGKGIAPSNIAKHRRKHSFEILRMAAVEHLANEQTAM